MCDNQGRCVGQRRDPEVSSAQAEERQGGKRESTKTKTENMWPEIVSQGGMETMTILLLPKG